MNIRKLLAVGMIAALCAGGTVLAEESPAAGAEEQNAPLFATVGEAMEADGYTGIFSGSEEFYSLIVEQDGTYIRVVADMDEEGRELNNAIPEAEDIDAAFAAYDEHVKTLPVSYTEELTAEPKTQEELDALVGKTLLEAEEEGYMVSSYGTGGEEDEVIYTMRYGMYEYDLVLNESYDVFQEHEENGTYGDLTVKSAAYAGLSNEAANLRIHADGTEDPEEETWGEYSQYMDRIYNALTTGEDVDALIQELTEEMPDQSEDIKMLVELVKTLHGQGE